MLWQITAYSSPKHTLHSDQKVTFPYSINISCIRKPDVQCFHIVEYWLLCSIKIFLISSCLTKTWIQMLICQLWSRKEWENAAVEGKRKTLDNLVAASLPSLRSPVNCEWNHINLLSFTPIAFHSALTWKLSVLKINVSLSVCINQDDSEISSNLAKTQKFISIQTGMTQNNHWS